MIKIIDKDILTSDAKMIIHQLGEYGSFGGGVAGQILNKYKDIQVSLNLALRNFKNRYFTIKKSIYVCFIKEGDVFIANCFSQKRYKTIYRRVKKCLELCKKTAKDYNIKKVAIPYKYGCGIATGDWDKVYSIIEKVFGKSDIDIEICRFTPSIKKLSEEEKERLDEIWKNLF